MKISSSASVLRIAMVAAISVGLAPSPTRMLE
jgi:hypothetical protein